MKPQNMLKDEQALAEKNKSNYYKRMKKNKYWKKGWEAAKKKLGEQDNPYKLTPEIIQLLRKRTLWEMGRFEKSGIPSKKRLREEAERQKKVRRHKHASEREQSHKHRKDRQNSHR